MKKKQSFFGRVIILIITQAIIKILGLIYKLYLINKEGFGDSGNAIYSSGFQIYAMLLIIAAIGVPNVVSNLLSEKFSIGDEKNAKRIFKTSFIIFSCIGFLSSLFLFVAAEYISKNILQIPETKLTLQVLAPAIFFASMNSVIRGYFNARCDMKPIAVSQTLEQALKAVFTILIVENIYKVYSGDSKTVLMAAGANLSTTIAIIVSYIYMYLYYKKNQINKIIKNNTYKDERYADIFRKVFSIAMPITISTLIAGLSKTIDSVTVVRGLKKIMSEESAKVQYGILSGKVETLINLPLSFNMAFIINLMPSIAATKAKNNFKGVNDKAKTAIIITLIIGIPCTIFMNFYAEQIFKLLFPNSMDGILLYKISTISILFSMLNQTIHGIMQGIGKHSEPIIAIGTGIVVKLILNLLLIPINAETFNFGGIYGVAIATVFFQITTLVINMLFLKRKIKFDSQDNKKIAKIILCVCITYIVSVIIKIIINTIGINWKIKFITESIITGSVYLILVSKFKCFENQQYIKLV